MNHQVALKYFISAGVLVFFSYVGDWFGVQYFRSLSDPDIPLLITRSLGGLGGFAIGLSWIRLTNQVQRYLGQTKAS